MLLDQSKFSALSIHHSAVCTDVAFYQPNVQGCDISYPSETFCHRTDDLIRRTLAPVLHSWWVADLWSEVNSDGICKPDSVTAWLHWVMPNEPPKFLRGDGFQ